MINALHEELPSLVQSLLIYQVSVEMPRKTLGKIWYEIVALYEHESG
jgi:hypothetical protein